MRKLPRGVLAAVKHVRSGVPVDDHKNTAELATVRMPAPASVVLPMQQGSGAPCTPTVRVGDLVLRGQIIGDGDLPLCVPIHAGVSGRVSAIGKVRLANGLLSTAVTIESDGEMRDDPSIRPPKVESRADLIAAIRASGLIGLGGAGFPTHVKLDVPSDLLPDTLIINAAECEPYLTTDYREIVEHPKDVMDGVYALQKHFAFRQVILAAEDNTPRAFEILKEIAEADDHDGDAVKLMVLRSRYAQGAEKMMVYSATGRKIPEGKLPTDVGCLVINVATVAFIGRYLRTGRPLISRSITVDGDAVATPKNVRVPIGTRIRDIFAFCGGFVEEPRKVLCGGPMMGSALCDLDAPVCKQMGALLAFAETQDVLKPERDCIRCGRCASVCPMKLLPAKIAQAAITQNFAELARLHVRACMECGSCAYACPSARPLTQFMRLAKEVYEEGTER